MRLRIVSLVLVAALAAGCDDEGTSAGSDVVAPETDAGSASAPGEVIASHTFAAADCSDPGFPVPLGVATDVPDEVDYLDDIVACTDRAGATIWLSNDSDAVWDIVRGAQRLPVSGEKGPFKLMFGVDAFTPGNEFTFPAGEPVEWHVNYELSAEHVAFEFLLDEFESRGQRVLVDALDARTPTGAAVVRCGSAFADLAAVDPTDEADTVLVDLLGSAAAGAQCRDSMDRLSLPDDVGRRPDVLDALKRRSAQTAVIENMSGKLSYAKTAADLAEFAVRLR